MVGDADDGPLMKLAKMNEDNEKRRKNERQLARASAGLNSTTQRQRQPHDLALPIMVCSMERGEVVKEKGKRKRIEGPVRLSLP